MQLPVYDERGGAFARLRDRRVLVYWPHGLGDFVHFGYVLPLLEPSNTYFITRFGDDYVHLYDGCSAATPLYSGDARPTDGSAYGARHLGIDFKRIRNAVARVDIPEPLQSRVREAHIDTVLYTDYPEREGKLAFPFHTKARALARDLISPQRLAGLPMIEPLASALHFVAPRAATPLVEERLRSYVGSAERLIVLATGGHTFPEKTWPEERVAAFAEIVRARAPRARVVTIDERTSDEIGRERGLAATTRDLFDGLDLPFAHVLVALIRACDAFAGVVSGPLHAALAIAGRPIAGIWLAHYPDWYDEKTNDAIHLIGPQALKRKLQHRLATTTLPVPMRAQTLEFPTHIPTATDLFEALTLRR